jgi:hypothetical protein
MDDRVRRLLESLEPIADDTLDPPLTGIPVSVFALSAKQSDWLEERRDAEIGLRAYATPRMCRLVQTWISRLELMRAAAAGGEPMIEQMHNLFVAVRDRLLDDYHVLRVRLVKSTAAGLGAMTGVQRSLYYSIWMASLIARAMVDFFAAHRRGKSDYLERSALDFSYVTTMGEAGRRSIAILGDISLKEYTLGQVSLAIEALVRAADTHGNPTADIHGNPVGGKGLGKYWAALWMRVAQIVAGNWTEDERRSPNFLDIYGCTADHRLRDIDHGRLVRPLPLVAGGRRLRLIALERLEVRQNPLRFHCSVSLSPH